jgi:hypothetical protein
VPYLKRVTLSHDATAWARKQQVGNTPAKFLLMVLADYAGSDHSCWPGQAALSTLTEMSERTIRRASELLVQQGLIRVFYRYRADSSRRSCRYQLLLDGPGTELPETVDWRSMKQLEPDSVTVEPPDTVTGGPGQAVQTYRSESPVIPSKDPSLEPSPLIPGAVRTATGTRLPEDFIPTPDMREWFAAEKLHLAVDARIEHEKFVNYWVGTPGAKGRKLDWPRTWKNWMWTAAERAGKRPGNALAPISGAPYKPSTTDQKVAQTLELGRRLQQQMEESA